MLSKRTLKILENNDIRIYDRDEQYGEYYREIEFYSPEGEDVFETIFYDGTDEGFISAFKENAESFDADEHAAMWIDRRGKNGVPESIRDLLNDAQSIKNTLLVISKELESDSSECLSAVPKSYKSLMLWKNDFKNERDWNALCEALDVPCDTVEIEINCTVCVAKSHYTHKNIDV